MFNGKEASYDGRRGHDNTKGWNTEQFGHDRLKFHQREKLQDGMDKKLRVAAKEGDASSIRHLLQKHSDLNVDAVGGQHKCTALHYAARFGHVQCIDTLLRFRANPNLQNTEGRTALHWAASNGTAMACQILLEAGAKQTIRNRDGMTPLELANHFNNVQTIEVLRSYAQLGKDEHAVSAERVGVWGAKNVPQAPAGSAHNRHLGRDEVSVQRVGVFHNSWAHYQTVVTPNDRRHRYQPEKDKRYNHGRQYDPR